MPHSAHMSKMLFFFISSVQSLGGRVAKRLNFCEGRCSFWKRVDGAICRPFLIGGGKRDAYG
jgi:hypothetical protein